jgi:hypothetical protein
MAIFSIDDKDFFSNELGKLKNARSIGTEAHCSAYFEAVNRSDWPLCIPTQPLNEGINRIEAGLAHVPLNSEVSH